MKNRIFITAVAVAAAISAAAQGTISREVTVTRAYEPSVQDFMKMATDPDMKDTTLITPDFEYEAKPYPLDKRLSVVPLNPVEVNAVNNDILFPFYLKAGIGAPAQSVMDFRYTREFNGGVVVAEANHYGQYSKITNDQGDKAPTLATFNSLGVSGKKKLGKDLSVSGGAGYGFNEVTRYGYYNYGYPLPSFFDTSREELSQYFNTVKVGASAGNSFTDLSKFNFRIGVDYSHFMDRFSYGMNNWSGRFKGGIGAGEFANVMINADFSSNRGVKNHSSFEEEVLITGVDYNYGNDDWRFTLGAGLSADFTLDKNVFLPHIEIEKRLFDGAMTPFFELVSKTYANNYTNLAERNPYVLEGFYIPRTTEFDGRAGVKGTFRDLIKYKAYFGYTRLENYGFFVNSYLDDYYGNVFTGRFSDGNVWRAGLEAEGNPFRVLSLYGGAHYHAYDLDDYRHAGGMPDFELSFGAKYNYAKKIYIDLSGTFYGERYFYEERSEALNSVWCKGAFDLSLDVDFVINKQMGAFFGIDNILNQDVRRYNRYPVMGVNALAGVKLIF